MKETRLVDPSASDEHFGLSAGELLLEIAALQEIPYCLIALQLQMTMSCIVSGFCKGIPVSKAEIQQTL